MSVYVNDFKKIKKARQHAHQRSRHAVARSAPGDVAVAGCGLPALAAADVGRVRDRDEEVEREREGDGESCTCPTGAADAVHRIWKGRNKIEVMKGSYFVLVIE